jgi:hypothetical protein
MLVRYRVDTKELFGYENLEKKDRAWAVLGRILGAVCPPCPAFYYDGDPVKASAEERLNNSEEVFAAALRHYGWILLEMDVAGDAADESFAVFPYTTEDLEKSFAEIFHGRRLQRRGEPNRDYAVTDWACSKNGTAKVILCLEGYRDLYIDTAEAAGKWVFTDSLLSVGKEKEKDTEEG